MPCNSDYLEPTQRERYNMRVAKLLVYVNKQLGLRSSSQLTRDANNIYAATDYTPQLCSLVTAMDPETLERIVYDAHSSMSRILADWWEDHSKADKARRDKE